ncbi:MAG: hypothetical protein IJG02_09655 [Thermoguttaceae bacterium]|nr:hypothetical protein [Thermoguttaceae bacterium]
MKQATVIIGAIAALAAAWLVPVRCARAAETLLVGAAGEEILPDHPVMMGGFASRSRPHEGVRSPLFTRALYLAHGGKQLLWTVSDLVGIEPEDIPFLERVLSEATGVPADCIVISATHTHSSPLSANDCGKKDDDYFDHLFVPRLKQAALRAVQSAEPCTMTIAEGRCDLAHDRRNAPVAGDGAAPSADPSRAVADTRVPAVGFKRPDGSFKAVLLLYAMHPTSWSDQLLGAEWPGAAAEAIRQTFGDRTEPFVLQGAAGNINSPARKAPPEVMLSWGRALVDSVADALKNGAPEERIHFDIASQVIPVEYRRLSAEDVRATAERFRQSYSDRPDLIEAVFDRWEEKCLKALRDDTDHFAEAFVQAIALGKGVFVTTPFETFSHMNFLLAEKVPFPVYVVGFTNGSYTYLPDRASFDQGGYETDAFIWTLRFPIRPGALEKLADDLVPLLRQVGGKQFQPYAQSLPSIHYKERPEDLCTK